ncbi:MAG: N-acetylmannosamine-6-phosphate 2-epimerase [Thermomicrobiales bacterium]
MPQGSPPPAPSPAALRQDHLRAFAGGVVVSCQARPGNPLHGPATMAIMAQAAELGGAVGLRVNGPEDIAAVRRATSLPIMGIWKQDHPGSAVSITPTVASVREIVAAGATMVALDGTARPRPGGESLADVVKEIHRLGAVALADLATPEDLRHAVLADIDAVGTTLAGYTAESPATGDGPDFELLRWLVRHSPVSVFAEGRYWAPEQVAEAFGIGAAFVVVGTAITNPMAITARFVASARAASTPPERSDAHPA